MATVDDLAGRIRDYARSYGAPVVSSAWLAQHFGVDPRTIAAAVRPYGVKPGMVEGVRGYVTADLATLGEQVGPPADEPSKSFDSEEEFDAYLATIPSADPDVHHDAVKIISAALGHDVTPALRAAGLL